ncbi:YdeI/OmpD-associated family protein [Marinoscillum sp. MHG1-6]|uniref:YdeI/OmpD-associated family protein n=1 Tax=Marinoscillum sp. MHG1-6 TaxID=2959627 RepID=UPI002157B270|nr:YdeI/OmpD-associated family protein [Marinoscillum sp. MHG1-6]
MRHSSVDGQYLLQKFPGKGGWTYAEIPEIAQNKNNPFGWVKVKGSIDGFELNNYKLMPMGNGQLFLPVKASIRKAIKKSAGDSVHIILTLDESPLELPQEMIDCFDIASPDLLEAFYKHSEGERKYYLDWIYDAKKEETKAERIIKLIQLLENEIQKS